MLQGLFQWLSLYQLQGLFQWLSLYLFQGLFPYLRLSSDSKNPRSIKRKTAAIRHRIR